MKLRNQVALVLIPLIALPLALLGWIAFRHIQTYTEGTATTQIETTLDQYQLLLDGWVSTIQANAAALAQNSLIERYLVTENEVDRYTLLQPALLRLLQGYQTVFPEYYEIRILLPDGYEDVRSTLDPLPNKSEEENLSEYFDALSRSPEDSFASFIFNPDNGEPALIASHRLRLTDRSVDPVDTDETTRGYLVITARPTALFDHLEATRIQNSGYLFFANSNGRILAHPDPSKIGTVYPVETLSRDSDALPDGLGGSASENGSRVYFRRLRDDAYALAALPETELLAPSRRIGVLMLGATVLAILLSAAGLYLLLSRLVMTPISRLASVARQMGQGNLLAPVAASGSEEVNALARAFREMGANLHSSTEQARFLAYHDTLTGLPNRSMFLGYLKSALATARRQDEILAVLFLDLDDFKQVNDTLGHATGDKLLVAISELLAGCLRQEDTIARASGEAPKQMISRLGGDEFTILLPHIRNPYDAGEVAGRISKRLTQPLTVGGHKLYVGVSIGITLFPEDADNAESLLKNADIAMYHAKDEGKNNYQYFSPLMNAKAGRRLTLEHLLRDAVKNEQLFLVYQPIIDARSRNLTGVEALLRWDDPELGEVSPEEFIPIAEETGLIVNIGEWVLLEACAQNKAWQSTGTEPIAVSVNISSIQVNRGNLEEVVRAALKQTGLAPRWLQLEITESSVLSSGKETAQVFSRLRELGVQISLDDFGTGYSSLSQLRKFPIDNIKIDRSFICEVGENEDELAIAAAIVAMGRNLGIQTTAEGIETPYQAKYLKEQGCDFMQGFLFSHPTSPAEIQRTLEARKRANKRGEGSK